MGLLAAPDPAWAEQAEAAKAVWRQALGADFVACHHIGSTSVPDLPAKPIIDLLPVATSLSALDKATDNLIAQGYEAMGPFGLPGRRYFRKSAPTGQRLIHAHAYAARDPAIARHLAFRNLLRSDPDIRAAYAGVKRQADQHANGDMTIYMDLKDPFIKTHEGIALTLFPKG